MCYFASGMVRKVLLSSLVLIVVGLVLVVYADPQFRFILTSLAGGAVQPARSFNGTFAFPRSANGTFTRSVRSGNFATFGSGFGFNAFAISESLVGVALISVGLILVGIEMFAKPVTVK